MRRLAIQGLHESRREVPFVEAPERLLAAYWTWHIDVRPRPRIEAFYALQSAVARLPRAKYLFPEHILTYWDGGLRMAPRRCDLPRSSGPAPPAPACDGAAVAAHEREP
jgi:hypothetical protein